MILLAAFILFVFFGFAAAFLDLGSVRLTQTQMMTSVEGSALEGLRFRDAPWVDGKVVAVSVGRFVFDDDLDPSSLDHTLGAGPTYELSGGVGATANALQTLEDQGNYRPHQQLNLFNQRHGDLVEGTYFSDDLLHLEDAEYERTDFAPFGELEQEKPDAFLARLRRTNDFQGLDNVAGISSSGPSLPFLFGRAMSMKGNGTYEPRHHGLSVRATAIADARRVTLAGPRITDPDGGGEILGVLPLSFLRQAEGEPQGWDLLAPGTYALKLQGPDLVVTLDGEEVVVGRFTRRPRSPIQLGSQALPARTITLGGQLTGYAPIYQLVEGIDRVIGFGHVEVVQVDKEVALLFKRTGLVAPMNASGVTPGSSINQVIALLTEKERRQVWMAHRMFSDPLLAPVLAR